MNYFELYDLPISFHPDQNVVKQKFYALSKEFHPDFFINSSTEKQEEVLEKSTLNNKAFQVLKSPQQTLQYVLDITGTVVEGENYALPQDFLMEMMDVNETLMDLEFDPDPVKLQQVKEEVAKIEHAIKEKLDGLIESYDHATASREEILSAIKDVFYRNKYLLRIKEGLVGK